MERQTRAAAAYVQYVGLVLTVLIMSLTSPAIHAANAGDPGGLQHGNCCERVLVETHTGNRYENRWSCFMDWFQVSCACGHTCDCGIRLSCLIVTINVAGCQQRSHDFMSPTNQSCDNPSADGPPGPNDTQSAMWCEGNGIVPCESLDCQREMIEQQCLRACERW